MDNPLISIVIPVYNGSNYVGEAIDSALAQTYKNVEIIVVNDGSKDDGATERIVLSYGDKVRYFRKENGGVSSALNLSIANMKGEYFSWLSHDDLYLPEKIEMQVNAVNSEDEIALCSGCLIDENKKKMPYNPKMLKGKYNGRELFKEFIKGYSLNGLGFLVPKKVFDHVGDFDETMRYLQDLDLWLRMMQFDYKFVCQNEMLVASRVHKNQVTNTASNLFDVDREKLAKKHVEILNKENNKYKNDLLELYFYLFIKGNNKEGIDLIKKQLKADDKYRISIIIKKTLYVIKGSVKRVFRKAYRVFLKQKHERR